MQDENASLYGYLPLPVLLHHRHCKGTQGSHDPHQGMVQLHMEYIFLSSHHQNNSYLLQIHFDAVLNRNWYDRQFPTIHPNQMGIKIRYHLSLYYRKKVLLYHGHGHAFPLPWYQDLSAIWYKILSNKQTTLNPYPVHRKIQVPSVQILWYGT